MLSNRQSMEHYHRYRDAMDWLQNEKTIDTVTYEFLYNILKAEMDDKANIVSYLLIFAWKEASQHINKDSKNKNEITVLINLLDHLVAHENIENTNATHLSVIIHRLGKFAEKKYNFIISEATLSGLLKTLSKLSTVSNVSIANTFNGLGKLAEQGRCPNLSSSKDALNNLIIRCDKIGADKPRHIVNIIYGLGKLAEAGCCLDLSSSTNALNRLLVQFAQENSANSQEIVNLLHGILKLSKAGHLCIDLQSNAKVVIHLLERLAEENEATSNEIENTLYALGKLAEMDRCPNLSDGVWALNRLLVRLDQEDEINIKAVANTIYALGKLAQTKLCPNLSGSAEVIINLLVRFARQKKANAIDIANMFYGLSKLTEVGLRLNLSSKESNALNDLVTSLARQDSLEAQQIAITFHALGNLIEAGYNLDLSKNSGELNYLLVCLAKQTLISPQAISNTFYGLSQLNEADCCPDLSNSMQALNHLLSRFANEGCAGLSTCDNEQKHLNFAAEDLATAQAISNLIYSLGKLAVGGYCLNLDISATTLNQILKHLTQLDSLDQQAISNTFYGLCKLAEAGNCPDLSNSMLLLNDLISSVGQKGFASEQQIVNTFYGIGKLIEAGNYLLFTESSENALSQSLKNIPTNDFSIVGMYMLFYGLGNLLKNNCIKESSILINRDYISQLLKRFTVKLRTSPKSQFRFYNISNILISIAEFPATLFSDKEVENYCHWLFSQLKNYKLTINHAMKILNALSKMVGRSEYPYSWDRAQNHFTFLILQIASKAATGQHWVQLINVLKKLQLEQIKTLYQIDAIRNALLRMQYLTPLMTEKDLKDIQDFYNLTQVQIPSESKNAISESTIEEELELILNPKEIQDNTVKFYISNPDDIKKLVAYANSNRIDIPFEYKSSKDSPTPNVYIAPVAALEGNLAVYANQDLSSGVFYYQGKVLAGNVYNTSAYAFNAGEFIIDAENEGDFSCYMNHSETSGIIVEDKSTPTKPVIKFKIGTKIARDTQVMISYGDSFFGSDIVPYAARYLDPTDNWKSAETKYTKFFSEYDNKLIVLNENLSKTLGFAKPGQLLVLPKICHAILNKTLTNQLLENKQIDLLIYAADRQNNEYRILPPAQQQHITPLMFAAYYGDALAINMLLEKGADVNRRTLINGHHALFILLQGEASNTDKSQCFDILVKNSYLTLKDVKGFSLLHYAIIHNNPLILEKLLDKKRGVQIRDDLFSFMLTNEGHAGIDDCIIMERLELCKIIINSATIGWLNQAIAAEEILTPRTFLTAPRGALESMKQLLIAKGVNEKNLSKIFNERMQQRNMLDNKTAPQTNSTLRIPKITKPLQSTGSIIIKRKIPTISNDNHNNNNNNNTNNNSNSNVIVKRKERDAKEPLQNKIPKHTNEKPISNDLVMKTEDSLSNNNLTLFKNNKSQGDALYNKGIAILNNVIISIEEHKEVNEGYRRGFKNIEDAIVKYKQGNLTKDVINTHEICAVEYRRFAELVLENAKYSITLGTSESNLAAATFFQLAADFYEGAIRSLMQCQQEPPMQIYLLQVKSYFALTSSCLRMNLTAIYTKIKNCIESIPLKGQEERGLTLVAKSYKQELKYYLDMANTHLTSSNLNRELFLNAHLSQP